MANYLGMTRTNYFKIKDEARFREICNNLVAEDDIEVEVSQLNGDQYGFIGSYSPIDYCTAYGDDMYEDYDMTSFYKQIQEVISDGDAMIMTEVGHEKLRYLVGNCVIVTANDIKWFDLESTAIRTAQGMLDNMSWSTRNSY